MSLKVVHLSPAAFDGIRHKYSPTKEEEKRADWLQYHTNALYLHYVVGIDPDTGDPIEDDSTEAL